MARPAIELPESLEYALKIRHAVKAGWSQTYLLLTDCHWDSPESYIRLLHRHMREAVERDALIIDAGDFFDAINSRDDPRGSKGGIRKEHCKLNYLDVLVEDAIEEFRPYLDRIVYMGTGNHEQAITVRRETDLTQRFVDEANRLRGSLPPIHRAGYTGWIRFFFCLGGTQRLSHAMKIEHGTGGNSPVTKGTIQANRRASRTEGATFFVSGHIHEQWDMSAPVETLNTATSRVELRNVKHIQLGSYKMDFRLDGAGTWAQMKMGSPKPIGGKWLRFWTPNGRDVAWDVQDAWVDYPNLSGYLRRSKVVVERAAAAVA